MADVIQAAGWSGGQPAWGAPYSLDLRQRVVAAVADGMNCAEAAEHYQVSHSSAIRWAKRQAETGSPAALPMGGKKPFVIAGEAAWIHERVAEQPDLTGRALLAELNAPSVDVSYYGVWHFLVRTGLSFKKACAPASRIALTSRGGGGNGRSDRTRFVRAVLIFIDETCTKTNMTRTHGRCARGQRLVAKVPHGQRRTLTFVVGLRCDGIIAPCILDSPINAENFLPWVEQFLVPTLGAGDIVVMDNLRSHKKPTIRQAIRRPVQAILSAALQSRP